MSPSLQVHIRSEKENNFPVVANKVLNGVIAATKFGVGTVLIHKGSYFLSYLIAPVTNARMAKQFSKTSYRIFYGSALLGGIYNCIDGVRTIRKL